AQPKRLAGDRLGVVPDALELEVDADACVGEPQQPGRRLVADQEAEAESIELLLHLVDVAVAEDDRVGQVTVPAEHGPDATADRPLCQPALLDVLLADLVEVLLVRM